MIDKLKEMAAAQGHKLAAMPIERLGDVKSIFDKRGRNTSRYFDFGPREDLGFVPRSIIIVAYPLPAFSCSFTVKSDKRRILIPPGFINSILKADYLTSTIEENNLHIARGRKLPAKAIAACTGLGTYGRNDLIVVDSMGSLCSLALFFTDITCENEFFDENAMENAVFTRTELCGSCGICLKNCPTGALNPLGETVDVERCLCRINMQPGDFPDWIKPEWHNALVGCLACQDCCPHNIPFLKDIAEIASFNEEETEAILKGAPAEGLDFGGLNELIPRNLRVLLR